MDDIGDAVVPDVGGLAALSATRLFERATRVRAAEAANESTAQPVYGTDEDYGYGSRLTDIERTGRDTWYFWTGGNQKFWVRMAELTDGNVDLLNYVDSRRHGRRFRDLGAVTQPGCQAATGPDQYGLWMDTCAPDDLPRRLRAAGGHRRPAALPRIPTFNPAKWDAEKYRTHPKGMQPPYLIGMACGFCHVGFNPLNPPVDPERPRWSELAGAIGNQYWEEGRLFNLKMTPKDFRWHLGNRQPPGTSDTSRFATDHITTRATSTPSSCSATGRPRSRRCPTAPSGRCPTSSRTAPTRSAWPARRCGSTSTSGCARTTG